MRGFSSRGRAVAANRRGTNPDSCHALPQVYRMSADLIYHGTPLTPRAALLDVLAGRAACVSFFRPDDVEAVEAVCPHIMFRQRSLQRVAGSAEARGRLVHPFRLDTVFRLVGASPFPTGTLGSDAGCTGCAKPAQRCTVAGMAVRGTWSAAVAHGRANRPAVAALRETSPRLPWLDRKGQASGQARLSRPDGRGVAGHGQPVAPAAHDARANRGANVSLCQRGRHQPSAERVAI